MACIAQAFGDLLPLGFERRQIGLRGFDVDQPIHQRHAVGIAFSGKAGAQIAVTAGNRRLPVGIGGGAGDLRQFFTCLRQGISQFAFGLRRRASIGLLDVGAPIVEHDQLGFRLGDLGLRLEAGGFVLPVLTSRCCSASDACTRRISASISCCSIRVLAA